MPYPKTSSGYPAAMRALVEQVVDENLGRRIVLENESKARGLRSRYYQYVNAIKRDLINKPPWLDDASRKDLVSFLKRIMTVEFVVEDNTMLIRPRDLSPLMDSLLKATIIEPSLEPHAEQADKRASFEEESLARLLGKIK